MRQIVIFLFTGIKMKIVCNKGINNKTFPWVILDEIKFSKGTPHGTV